jgi:hypothetical protein
MQALLAGVGSLSQAGRVNCSIAGGEIAQRKLSVGWTLSASFVAIKNEGSNWDDKRDVLTERRYIDDFIKAKHGRSIEEQKVLSGCRERFITLFALLGMGRPSPGDKHTSARSFSSLWAG